MVVNRLKWYLEFYSLLSEVQSGFRHRRKTTDHILRLHDIVTKSLANKHHVLAVFIDIEKAYDKVSKDALLLKLLKIGINGNMFSFIRSFLSNRSFQVRVGSSLSQIKFPANGIPQGSILSPVLFSILINDLPGSIRSRTALYADDFSFWESGSCIRKLNDLCQHSLTKVEKWCDKWGFQISQSKSAAVLFTNKRNLPPICLKLQQRSIPVRNEYKFLGITFQRNGTYYSHIERVHSKCLQRLNLLRMLTGTSWDAATSPLLHIYRALIRSVLEYGTKAYFLHLPLLSKNSAKYNMLHYACVQGQ